ncbi:SCO1860 family LAETG-anchored protein [Streptomyces sp. NPDC051940]|uniref:SCO1860 family LAETG-anchored protein n=1 Tax=Streptomyces sp. NPDC051940 TaxID=3155675 RepID=UPI00344A0A8D
MNSPTPAAVFGRRVAGAFAATALATVPVALIGAPSAHATGGDGRASAAVLRAGLDVSLLNKSIQVPLHTSLNEVNAPASAEKTALTVTLDGVDQGQPVTMLGAEVAKAEAHADKRVARAKSQLAHAKVYVPGLPALSLIEVEAVTSTAVCEAGKRPRAESVIAGPVRILGKSLKVTVGGPPTTVNVPAVGQVSLGFSQTRTTEKSATAAALELKVSVDPLHLNVAEVEGRVSLVEAACESPAAPAGGGHGGSSGGTGTPDDPAADVKPQTSDRENLAETGGSSATPVIAGAAVVLLGAGAGGVVLARRRGER